MPKYNVRLRETVTYDVMVEAENGYDAQELAAEIWADSEDPTKDFSGDGEGVVPLWFEEITEARVAGAEPAEDGEVVIWHLYFMDDERTIIEEEILECTRKDAENRASELWNEHSEAVLHADRYILELTDQDGDSVVMSIGGPDDDEEEEDDD